VTKAAATDTSISTPRRRGRKLVQYVVLLAGGLLIVNALVGDRGLLAMMKARQQYRELEGSLERVRSDNVSLREQARRLREDPAAIEDIARRELGLIRPGEKLFIVKDIGPGDPSSAP
jgi:cell division protein FtsB